MHEPPSSFAVHMASVAAELLGAPNLRLSSDVERRYGSQGSVSIDLANGTFYDHEAKSGGGVLDLIARHNGCDHKAAIEWMKQHGYLEPDREEQQFNGKALLGREVAHYDYVNENDELLFQVVRFEPKTFRQRRKPRPDDAPDKIKYGWVYSVRDIDQVPYRLPELVETIANGNTVFVVEGEKDADNLHKIGVPATCNPGGVGKWHNGLTAYFQDADVVIIQDNDPQAHNPEPPKGDGKLRFHPDGRPVLPGQDHAQDVAKQVQPIASRVRVLDLAPHWPDMPLKGDVSDWIKGGGTADALHALVAKTPTWAPAPFKSKFGGLRWEQIATLGHETGYTWLIEDIIPMGEISLAFGDSGSGKSFGIFDMGMSCARGLKWNGKNVEPGLVIYVAAEAGKGFGKRKLAYSIQHELPHGQAFPFYLCTKRPDFFSSDDDLLALMEEIEAICKSYGEHLVLIVIDTLSALAPGMNENASQDVSMVRKRLVRLQERFGVAVVLVHHKPKGGSQPRGHSSLTADFETTIEFELSDRKTSSGGTVHKATVRKQREGKSGIKWEFTLPVIAVGQNKWGNTETSCAVVPFDVGQVTQQNGYNPTANERQLMIALYDAINEHGMPPPFKGLPKEITKVVDVIFVRDAMRAKMVDPDIDEKAADNRFRAAFKRSGDKLRDAGVIGIQKPFWWPSGKPVNGL